MWDQAVSGRDSGGASGVTPRDLERLGAVGCSPGTWEDSGSRFCTWSCLKPQVPSKKFLPQYPNENEQQKGKLIFGLGSLRLPKKFININKGFVEQVEILFALNFPAEEMDYEHFPGGLVLRERGDAGNKDSPPCFALCLCR